MYYILILLHIGFAVLMNLHNSFTVNDTILQSLETQLNVFLRMFTFAKVFQKPSYHHSQIIYSFILQL